MRSASDAENGAHGSADRPAHGQAEHIRYFLPLFQFLLTAKHSVSIDVDENTKTGSNQQRHINRTLAVKGMCYLKKRGINRERRIDSFL